MNRMDLSSLAIQPGFSTWDLSVPLTTTFRLYRPVEISCFFCGRHFLARTFIEYDHEACRPCEEAHYD